MSKAGKALGWLALGALVAGGVAWIANKVKEVDNLDLEELDDLDEDDFMDEAELEEALSGSCADAFDYKFDDSEVISSATQTETVVSEFEQVCGVSREVAIQTILDSSEGENYSREELIEMSDEDLTDIYAKIV